MHRLGFVLSEGFQLMALATQAVFEFANDVVGDKFYGFACYSVAGGDLTSSSGVRIGTRPLASCTEADTWLVPGASDPIVAPAEPEVLRFLRRAGRHARRMAGLCTGGFVLAEAGLLDGRRATTHWLFARDMQARHPDVRVDDDRIFIVDGPVWTSAGMTAALDLALAMVEADLGGDVARAVAHKLVMPQRRTGGQSQHSELLELAPKSDRIQQALDYARGHLKQALSVEALAGVANLSPRQFSRVFAAETGQSPAKAVEGLRLEAARLMIEQSRHPLEVVARESGFRDRRHLREVFIRHFGVPPQLTRRGARSSG
ncbi:transcriptional regulator GlxA family with amidase domain [Pelomonas saccharophila]|uniref:Transcriptional regulator GlxA family with amidase domain n=1 Tax=Roseateles saccharophilus TaxID=304 RepID=A0ABU1YRF5_ROSSA|nr:GlxA family transcriptional regulator [Roseateles saccharophilus]MDR7270786.1 transcriptional regulator GlxA family with amidase domain [Roseateles saccharophilus]